MKRAYSVFAMLAVVAAATPAMARPWGYGPYYHGWDYPGPAVVVHEVPPPVIVEEDEPVIVHERVIVHDAPPPPQTVIVTQAEPVHISISATSRDVILHHLYHRTHRIVHHDYEIGRQISADYRQQVVPDEVVELLEPVPPGYRYARVDDDVVLLSPRGNVMDVVELH